MNYLTKNFLLGIGSALSVFPSTRVDALDDALDLDCKSDRENLAGDWNNVGQDLYCAMGKIRNEQEETKNQ